jgi:hypothetical protein
MNIQEYQDNRSRHSQEELRRHEGQWVAFSCDGNRIVAASADLQELHDLVKEAGENPEAVCFERIAEDDWQGGIELE